MYGTSNAKLYEEIGWLTLAKRREISKLTLMYKFVNKLAPVPICSIIDTASTSGTQPYNTCQQFDLPHFRARTELFDNSFFPATVRLWNQLPLETRNSASIQIFKSKITPTAIRPTKFPELYNFGNRFLAVQHTCLLLDASQLNSHLFKIGVNDSPKCSCGSPSEDSWHYIFTCPSYAAPRSILHTKISRLAPFTLRTVLFGSFEGSFEENSEIFSAVQEFISKMSRFKPTGIG